MLFFVKKEKEKYELFPKLAKTENFSEKFDIFFSGRIPFPFKVLASRFSRKKGPFKKGLFLPKYGKSIVVHLEFFHSASSCIDFDIVFYPPYMEGNFIFGLAVIRIQLRFIPGNIPFRYSCTG